LRCIEDGVVPVGRLEEYVVRLREILRRNDCDGAIFGHAGDAHIHVNPQVDIAAPRLSERIDRLMEEVSTLVWELGGSISGEHGDGMLRTDYVSRQWEPLMGLFREVKAAFDPKGILNPGKKLSMVKGSARPRLRKFESELPSAPTCLTR
jgi:FAD/FMN-containing dehydrogenase